MERLVVASLLGIRETTIYVIDPEDVETPEQREKRERLASSEVTSERIDNNVWFIPDPEKFQSKATDARAAQLLTWAGQFRKAAAREARIEIAPRIQAALKDRPLLTREIGGLRFDGVRVPLFPELGQTGLTLFTGLERNVMESVMHDEVNTPEILREQAPRFRHAQMEEYPGSASIGPSGTVLAVEGLE